MQLTDMLNNGPRRACQARYPLEAMGSDRAPPRPSTSFTSQPWQLVRSAKRPTSPCGTKPIRLCWPRHRANATYVDPLMRGSGHGEIDELIAAAQAKFPGLRFSLLKPADGFGDHARFSWGLGPQGREPIIKGTDFVVRDGDRIRSVVGFLDQVPAGS